MTVKKMLIDYMTANNFNALCGEDCGCDINDLCPCDNNFMDCVFGYKQIADCKKCEKTCNGYMDAMICYTTKKPVEVKNDKEG